jgi:Spy/CpxP family protein refolding chaperone
MKTFFHTLILTIVLSTLSQNAFAQQPDNDPPSRGKRGDKVEALRIAFITEKLNLTPAEAQQFWPVFNEHHAKMREIRAPLKDAKNVDSMTDAEVEKMIANYFDIEQRTLNIQKEYYIQLKKVLSVRKVAKLHKAERDFKNRLIEHIGGNSDAAPPPPSGGRPQLRPHGRRGRF